MGFVHLHNHSQFTILNGMPSPPAIVAAAEELGMPAVAITDTCNLFGAVQFHKAAKKSSVKAIFGSEIWMCKFQRYSRHQKDPTTQTSARRWVAPQFFSFRIRLGITTSPTADHGRDLSRNPLQTTHRLGPTGSPF